MWRMQVSVLYGDDDDRTYSRGDRACTSVGNNITLTFHSHSYPGVDGDLPMLKVGHLDSIRLQDHTNTYIKHTPDATSTQPGQPHTHTHTHTRHTESTHKAYTEYDVDTHHTQPRYTACPRTQPSSPDPPACAALGGLVERPPGPSHLPVAGGRVLPQCALPGGQGRHQPRHRACQGQKGRTPAIDCCEGQGEGRVNCVHVPFICLCRAPFNELTLELFGWPDGRHPRGVRGRERQCHAALPVHGAQRRQHPAA